MCFTEHIDVMIGKALLMLRFLRRACGELRDPYTLKAQLYILGAHKSEYASCVWAPFCNVHVNRLCIVRGLGWTDLFDLLPDEHRCALTRFPRGAPCLV
jgi:hypothetical protein